MQEESSDSAMVALNEPAKKDKVTISPVTKLSFYAIGIFVCYFYYGIVTEKITRSDYGTGENKERFKYSFVLVFVQCVTNTIFAKLLLATIFQQGIDHTRTLYYASSAFSYLGAMVSSNMALQHVNYPTQVVGKSCKPIPVMVLGVLIGRKKYSLAKYIFVCIIVIGVGLFMYKDKPSSAAVSTGGLGMGEFLLLISLTLDGFTGAVQERMKSEHKTKSVHMMYYMNLWSTFFLSFGILLTGELWPFLQFVQRYPYVIYNIAALSIASALGQLFIFLTVAEFGPLPCSLVTTLRKFFTVLFSVVFFGNTLILRQWLGATLVFTGPLLEVATTNPGLLHSTLAFFKRALFSLVPKLCSQKSKHIDVSANFLVNNNNNNNNNLVKSGLALDSFYGKPSAPPKAS